MQPAPKLIAVAGPKGGCGKTTFTAGLAKSFADLNRSTRIVCLEQQHAFDAARNLRLLYRMQDTGMAKRNGIQEETSGHGIANHICVSDFITISSTDKTDTGILLEEARQCDADFVIFDCPPRYQFAALFDSADFPILMAIPEPNSMLMAAEWIRYIIRYRLSNAPGILEKLTPPGSWIFQNISDSLTPDEQQEYCNTLNAKNTFFVLNERREGCENTQAEALCHACWAFLGYNMQFLGSLRFEERRWFFSRMFSCDDPLSQDDSMKQELAAVARNILDYQSRKIESGVTVNPIRDSRGFLRPEPGEEPRHAYRRLYEGYRRENSIVEWAFSAPLVKQAMTMLDAAWQHIHFEMNGGASQTPAQNATAPRESFTSVPIVQSPEKLPDVSRKLSGTFAKATIRDDLRDDNAGEWLRACRLNTGITIPQLSCKTRISQRYISLIEQNSLASFSPAHLKAYLFEIAKALSLPLPEILHKFGFRD